MPEQALRYVILSQVMLFAFLGLAILIEPRFLTDDDQGGVSNYGVLLRTVVPYTLAFGGAAYFYNKTRLAMPSQTRDQIEARNVLAFLAVLIGVVIVTTYPYKLSDLLSQIHAYTTIGLFLCQFTVAIWMGLFVRRDFLNGIGLVVAVVGFGIALATFLGFIQRLFAGQLIFAVGAGIVLINTVRYIAFQKA